MSEVNRILQSDVDVAVIGGGPAGLAAACSAAAEGASVVIVEREERPGGILKQCIHDGFGLKRFAVQLTGPEYAWREIEKARALKIPFLLDTFLISMTKAGDRFNLTLVNREGVIELSAGAVVAATGCRERTDRQIFIQGSRPAGIFTAGQAQYFINIQGNMPVKRAVILGSGDIGLIMARRLTLEGAEVEGVYEIKSEPSGLTRNVVQCLEDFDIPLHLSTTVLSVQGKERVESVTVATVDENGLPVPGTERVIPCDSLVLSVGLIPENDILEPLGVEISSQTSGPVVDQGMMTGCPGLFSCGNALHVNDLADFVSESGEAAGRGAARFASGQGQPAEPLIDILPGEGLLYAVPQRLDPQCEEPVVIYFRSRDSLRKAGLQLVNQKTGEVILEKRFPVLRPPEMERVELSAGQLAGLVHSDAGAVEVRLAGELMTYRPWAGLQEVDGES